MEKSIGLGDVVSFNWKDGYDNGTVSHIHLDGTIDVFRPYTATADFSCAGRDGSSQVLCYVGIEEVKNINPDKVTLIRKVITLRWNPANKVKEI